MARTTGFDEEEVLDRAVDLFWRKGYADTSAQDLVDALGLNRSSLYNSFGDKHTLFRRALERYADKELSALQHFLEKTDATVEGIGSLLENVVRTSLDRRSPFGCFMLNSTVERGVSDAAVRRLANCNVAEVVDAFTRFIARGQRAGTLRAGDPEPMAIALFHTTTALRVTTKVMRDPAFFKACIDAQLNLFKP